MKAILIARVSTEEQREAGNSLPAQVARLERYCQNKGFIIEHICSFDESAYSNDRSEFDRIIDLILSKKEKVMVCCDKVDRLSRNVFDKRIAVLYEKALNDEIELHFISDGQIINSRISAVEKFQFGISLGLAKYYSDAISDNVRRAIEQKLRKGECVSKAPFGYKNVVVEGKKGVVVDEQKAHVVVKTYELYATGAYSMDILCKHIKDAYGVSWQVSQIDKVLKNHFYYGVMMVNNKLYPHCYPPILTHALFEQVQQVKAGFNRKKTRIHAGPHPHFYRGLIRCAICGLSVTPERQKGLVYYHCTQYNGKHNAKWLREEEITEQLAAVFKSLQMPKDILQEVVETLRETHENKVEFQNNQVEELSKEQRTVTRMMDNLYLDKLKGSITEANYDRFYQSLREKITDINVRLEQLQEAEDNYYITAKYVLELAQKAHKLFLSSEVEERRQLINLVLSNLRLDSEKLVYDAVKPFDLMLKCSNDLLWRP